MRLRGQYEALFGGSTGDRSLSATGERAVGGRVNIPLPFYCFIWILCCLAIRPHVVTLISACFRTFHRGSEGVCGDARFELSVRRAHQHERAVVAERTPSSPGTKGNSRSLKVQVHDYRRTKFRPEIGKARSGADGTGWKTLKRQSPKHRRGLPPSRKKIKPAHPIRKKSLLARSVRPRRCPNTCAGRESDRAGKHRFVPCGCGNMVRIGEKGSRTERLDPDSGALRGDRHDPPEIRMPQGSNGRHPGQSASASAGRAGRRKPFWLRLSSPSIPGICRSTGRPRSWRDTGCR